MSFLKKQTLHDPQQNWNVNIKTGRKVSRDRPLTSAIVSASFQIVLFSSFPFAFYVISHQRTEGFFSYIGLYPPELRTLFVAGLLFLLFFAATIVLFPILQLSKLVAAPNTVVGRLQHQPLTGRMYSSLAVVAFFQTALSEEIFFRGFLAKRLIDLFGFWWGNFAHAAAYGLIHLILVVSLTGAPLAKRSTAGLFLYTAAVGGSLAFVNEYFGNGSIMPGWGVHGLLNFVLYVVFIRAAR